MPEETLSPEAGVVVTLRLQFLPGTLDRVLERIVPIALLTREEPGNVSFDVFRARDDDDRLVILERWRDQDALDSHWAEPYTQEVLALFEDNLVAPLSETEDVTYLRDQLPRAA